MKTLSSIPRRDGFRMPGEFEQHQGCWILFPERSDNWRDNAEPAQEAFSNVARTIAQFENVKMGVSAAHFESARRLLPKSVKLVELEYDDAWIRDTGPTCVVNPKGIVRGVDWGFNSWGGLFRSWDKDNQVARKVIELEGLDRYESKMILEGGAVNVDGEGTLLAVKECVMNPNRNPIMSLIETENTIKDYLGVEKIIWLPKGLYLDETGGHIDNLCCFIHPGTIAIAWTDDRSDPQWEISTEAFQILKSEMDAKGRKFEIFKIHQPAPMFMSKQESDGIAESSGTISRKEGDRLAASYVNFYIANGGIIMPSYNDPMDESAKDTLQTLFPNRRVVDVSSREILLGGGSIHCIVQQIPYSFTRG